MQLPGGIVIDGKLERDFRFKDVTGALEMDLSECMASGTSQCTRVTGALEASLAQLGPTSASGQAVRNLCTGDRQFLMHRLAAHIDDGPIWLTATCGGCGAKFDVSFRHSELPVKPAGPGFPWAETALDGTPVRLRLPTGADQETIGAIADEGEAVSRLVKLLIENRPAASLDLAALSEADLDAMEAALEAVSPEVATALLARCPSCATEQSIAVPPVTLSAQANELLSDVHRLATHYHWSERAILGLKRTRRRSYLQLIDASRGMHSDIDQWQIDPTDA